MSYLMGKWGAYLKIISFVLFFLAYSTIAFAGDAILSWDPNDWNTDPDLAGYKVYYGTASGNYTNNVDIGLINPDSVPTYTVNNLTEGNTYYFTVTAYDTSGNESGFSNEVFKSIQSTTTDTTSPIISAIQSLNIGSTSASINWTTDEPATSQVEYGTTTAYGSVATLNSTLQTAHSQILSGLQPSTTYYYRVKSTDISGNQAVSGNNSFLTNSSADITPPGDIQDFTALGNDGKITLSWTNPSDSDFVGVHIIFRTDRFPNDINDGTLLGEFTGEPNVNVSTVHSVLENGVTYYYAASSYDSQGNFQSTAFVSATPSTDASSNVEAPHSSSSGGCGMIMPKDGKPPGPGQMADVIAIAGVFLWALVKKGLPGIQIKRYRHILKETK